MVNEKPIRERVIEIAQAVVEEEFTAVCAEDGHLAPSLVIALARPLLRSAVDGVVDCRGYEKMSDEQIRADVAPPLRQLVRQALASRRPS